MKKENIKLIEFKIAKLTFLEENKERNEKELERYYKKNVVSKTLKG